ncbi:MAG: hypothetical protein E7E21_00835 [Peptostreptococcaceae bacterium]|nr:hypothetical protein [Peptostreptococcaceae bacterium]MDU4933986.1 hypothetical protein [Peptostreptococcaceae bacterium]
MCRYKNYYVYVIRYTFKNGSRGEQKILSKCDNIDKLVSIFKKQLDRAKRAKFKVLINKNTSCGKQISKVVDGWLLNMDISNFYIELM